MNDIRMHRVVTGHNAEGRSCILFEDAGTNHTDIDAWPGFSIDDLWVTEETPARIDATEDRATRPLQHDPAPNGSLFRRLTIPGKTSGDSIDAEGIFEAMGSENRPTDEMRDEHFTMHRTDSIDYVIVLSGSMRMVMDEGETTLYPGTCIVQQGTNHAWVNDNDEPCELVAVLIDARTSQ